MPEWMFVVCHVVGCSLFLVTVNCILTACALNVLQYRATDFVVPGDGKLEISFTPSAGGEAIRYTVFDFKGTGGVALAMYNTDEVFEF